MRWAQDDGDPTASRFGSRLPTLARRAVDELRAGTAEREAELRTDLLAGADLPHARARVDAWRAERAARADGAERAERPDRPAPDDATGGPTAPARPGSAAAAGRRRGRGGAHRAEDPDDGDLGYSFY